MIEENLSLIKSKNKIAENSVALGHDTHNRQKLVQFRYILANFVKTDLCGFTRKTEINHGTGK